MTMADTLHDRVAEAALERRRELQTARAEALETSASAAESLGLGFHLGAAMERIALAAGEGSAGGRRLREAAWLIERYVTLLESRLPGTDFVQAPGEPAPELTPAPSSALDPEPEPEPVQLVHALPSVRRELLVTAARAAIYVAAVTVVVLLLTLIAQWL
jgi:hypothetical protein